jgi:hypothetical protein
VKTKLFRKLTFFIAVVLSVTTIPVFAIPPQAAIGYWTEAMMKSAKPLELVMDARTGIGQLQIGSQAEPQTTGSDWTGGQLPQTAVGKVFFSIGRSNYVCSGSVLSDGDNSNLRSIVITAGHCTIDRGKFVTNFMFVPNYDEDILDNSISPQNRWYAQNLVVNSQFASQRQFNVTAIQNDWAFAVIRPGTFTKNRTSLTNPSGNLDGLAGAFTYSVSGFSSAGNTSTSFGYPQAAPYNGRELKYARGAIFADPNGYGTWGMNSTLTGGASGGPWLSTFDPNSPTSGSVSSVNSYKYTNDPNTMYGPNFNLRTTATLSAALGIISTNTADVIVP